MNQVRNSVQDCINLLKKEIYPIYSATEIQSFIRLIFEDLLGYSAIDLVEKRNIQVSDKVYNQLLKIIIELKFEKPIQYILGDTEFMGYKFSVNEGVLIPRSETEELVLWISESISIKNPEIIDIGTGSGCIAISLKKMFSDANVFGIDISESALSVAKHNSTSHNADVLFKQFDILNIDSLRMSNTYDIIVSNPPYVTNKEKSLMSKNVLEYEPDIALFVPDDDALIFYDAICTFAKIRLNPGGYIFFEINEELGDDVCELMRNYGFVEIELRKDINGKDRMVRGSFK